MRVLVVGCNGLLGQSLLKTLPFKYEAYGAGTKESGILPELTEKYKKLDITNSEEVKRTVDFFYPDLIINAAAMTDVDLCEKEKEKCWLLNTLAVKYLAETKVPLVHISTDYVFDGTHGPYKEEDTVNPISFYGKSKLMSEYLVSGFGHKNSIVARTMTLWGKEKGTKTSFVDFVKSSLEQGKTINVVTDQRGNPTLAEDLALGIWGLLECGSSGLYHIAGSEINSRFEWAQVIAKFYGLDGNLIKPCLTSDLKQLAPRPLQSGLCIDKLVSDSGFKPRGVISQLN